MNYKSIAEKAIANKHAKAYNVKEAGGAAQEGTSALLDYFKKFMGEEAAQNMAAYASQNLGRVAPGALVGAGMGGVGGFVTADGGRNMLTGQQYSPTIGQRVYSGLAGALGGGLVGGAGNFARPALSKALREGAEESAQNIVKNVDDAAKKTKGNTPKGKGNTPKGKGNTPKGKGKSKGVYSERTGKYYKDEAAKQQAHEQSGKANTAKEEAKKGAKRPSASASHNTEPINPNVVRPNVNAPISGVTTNIPGDTAGVTPNLYTTPTGKFEPTSVNMKTPAPTSPSTPDSTTNLRSAAGAVGKGVGLGVGLGTAALGSTLFSTGAHNRNDPTAKARTPRNNMYPYNFKGGN